MKTLGVGVDIIDNLRIKKSMTNKKFVSRIFTDIEIAKSKKTSNKIGYFSKRFAAKEAFSKALGTGFRKNITFRNIEVFNDNFGKPSIKINGTVDTFLKKKIKNKKYKIYLSLSDDLPWAQATVIISYNK